MSLDNDIDIDISYNDSRKSAYKNIDISNDIDF